MPGGEAGRVKVSDPWYKIDFRGGSIVPPGAIDGGEQRKLIL
jgi:hypothetical protein